MLSKIIILIYGTGIDIIETERVGSQVDKSRGFRDKVFTPAEIEYCESRKSRAENYAARFAVKEAFFKALGTGWRGGLAFNEVEVINDDLGKPGLVFYGKTKEYTEKNIFKDIHVTISHIKSIAVALVIIEK